jgi:hypothetical protein
MAGRCERKVCGLAGSLVMISQAGHGRGAGAGQVSRRGQATR